MADIKRLEQLAKLVRYYSVLAPHEAGSGHPTSSLSAADLMTALFFGGFYRFFPHDPGHPNNDRLLFSKGHASPLLYALWAAAGQLSVDDLKTYRKFGSTLEGHPTPRFRFADAATGSLGQGLSIGVGLALNAKQLDRLGYRTFVLLGDGEMAEGSQWEALELAAHYGLDNLIGILDVNRLGQSGETMYGHDLESYRARVAAFGWEAIVVEDGHDMGAVVAAFEKALDGSPKPKMLIARTIKGKGVRSIEDKNGFHGKALSPEAYQEALASFGAAKDTPPGTLAEPRDVRPSPHQAKPASGRAPYERGQEVATREAFGAALARLAPERPELVVLDGDVGNSTGAETFKKAAGDRYFEMYIAEQNMAGAAIGLSSRGKIPVVATFAAFFTRAYDQIRMSQYSRSNIKFCGTHAGVSIGEDGPSQMGLSDIALFRSLLGSAVLYPADAVSMEKLVEEALRRRGLVYLRATRGKTPVLYGWDEEFPIGGNKVHGANAGDTVALIAAGVTLFEALEARDQLAREGVRARVIDLYSVKPIDVGALRRALSGVKAIVTVEDHHLDGGLGEAVQQALSEAPLPMRCLAATRLPRSGKPEQLLAFEGLSAGDIVRAAKDLVSGRRRGRPQGLRTRIFLDGADPEQTRETLRLLGFLDGQTTNPTLLSKNPAVKERLARGARFSEDELLEAYRDVVTEISELIPEGSVSVEVYADASTRAEEMLRMGRRMSSWIPNAHVKFPSSREGIEAGARALSEGIRVNYTLCFSQQQAAAVYAATQGARRGDVFVSPFIGRLDDKGLQGMDLIANTLKMYRSGGDGHVEVLTASVRSLDHLLEAFRLGSDIVTAPFEVLKEWADKGLPLPGEGFRYPDEGRRPIPYAGLSLAEDWKSFDLRHELTAAGEEKFSKDWNSLVARQAAAR